VSLATGYWSEQPILHTSSPVRLSALGISTIDNDIDLLLGYISPAQAMYQD